jgi:hypothetical protein
MSQSLNTTPASLLGIDNRIKFFCFNRAIWTFGSALDQQLEEVANKAKKPGSAKAKQSLILSQWLWEPGAKGLFKDPAASL